MKSRGVLVSSETWQRRLAVLFLPAGRVTIAGGRVKSRVPAIDFMITVKWSLLGLLTSYRPGSKDSLTLSLFHVLMQVIHSERILTLADAVASSFLTGFKITPTLGSRNSCRIHYQLHVVRIIWIEWKYETVHIKVYNIIIIFVLAGYSSVSVSMDHLLLKGLPTFSICNEAKSSWCWEHSVFLRWTSNGIGNAHSNTIATMEISVFYFGCVFNKALTWTLLYWK